MRVLHIICACLLFVSHGFFLGRGLLFLRAGSKPRRIDRVARFFAQLGVPLVMASGLLNPARQQADFLLHILPVLLILLLVPLNFILRRLVLKTKQLPWLLPAVNFLLLLVAMLSGFWSC